LAPFEGAFSTPHNPILSPKGKVDNHKKGRTMKKLIRILLFVLSGAILTAGSLSAKETKEEKPRQLIVNAADGGLLHAINLGIERCYKEGTLTTATVIVPGPWFHHFAKMARDNPGLTVGIHLAVAGGLYPHPVRPVSPWSEVKSLVDHQGFMFDNVKDFQAHKPTFEHIKKELTAQIELAYTEGIDVAFIDNHMGNTEDIRRALKELGEEFGLPIKGKHGEIDVMDIYMTPPDEAPTKMAQLIAENVKGPGVYLSRHHPAWNTPEIQAVVAGNMPYAGTAFAEYRQGEAAAILSDEVKEVIKKKDIQLIGFYKKIREGIRSQMPAERREQLLTRIESLKKPKYAIPEGPYVFDKTPAVMAKTKGGIQIDGRLKEFEKATPILMDGTHVKSIIPYGRGKWGGEKDLSAEARILYDAETLYLALKVTDNQPAVNPYAYFDIHKGDNFELYVNTNPEITYLMRGMVKKDVNDIKITLAPSSKSGKPLVVFGGQEDITDKVKIVCTVQKDGYTMEAAIPRSFMKKNDWKTGDKLRFDAAISDIDEKGKLKTKIWWHAENRKAWQNPNFWGVAEVK